MGSRICNSIWGNLNFDWASMEAVGKSGGILSIWNDQVFCKTSAWFSKGVLVVNGYLREDGTQICIMNVYAPCVPAEREELWSLIRNVIAQLGNTLYCVVGDFNAIRDVRERVGRGSVVDQRDIDVFCNFISARSLHELPLTNRAYTWYKKDGSCKSKLDRILVCDD